MNTLPKSLYLSQRNNRVDADSACNVTSAIMAICQAGYKDEAFKARDKWNKITGNNFLQPEDALKDFAKQVKYREAAQAAATWEDSDYYYRYPAEHWQTLEKICNDFMGKPLVILRWSVTLNEIQSYILLGSGVFASGNFPGTAGHIVNIGTVEAVAVRINDPWGDYRVRYAVHYGYNIPMPFNEFRDIMKTNKDGTYKGVFTVGKKS